MVAVREIVRRVTTPRLELVRDVEVGEELLITSDTFWPRMLPGEQLPLDDNDVAPHLYLPLMKSMIQAVEDQKQMVFKYSDSIRANLLAIGQEAQFSDTVVQNAHQRRRMLDAANANEKGHAEAGARGYYDPALNLFVYDLVPNGSYDRIHFNLKEAQDRGRYPTSIVHRQPPGRRRFSYDDHAIMQLIGYENNDRLVRSSVVIFPETADQPQMYELAIATQNTPLKDEAGVQQYLVDSEAEYNAAGEQPDLWHTMETAYYLERALWREQLQAVNATVRTLENIRATRGLALEEEEEFAAAKAELDVLKEESQHLDQRPSVVAAADEYLKGVRSAHDEILRRKEEEMNIVKRVSYDGENWEKPAA